MTDPLERAAGWRQGDEGPAHYVANPKAGPTAVCGVVVEGGQVVANAMAGERCRACRTLLGEALGS